MESAEYTDEDGDLSDLDDSRKFLTSTTMRIKERYFGSDLSTSRQTIAKFEYNTLDSKRGDLVTKEIKYRAAGTTSEDEKEVTETSYTYRTVSAALGAVGIKPLATATVSAERELPSNQLLLNGVGDGNATLTKSLLSSTEHRAVRTWYDARNRAILTCPVTIDSSSSPAVLTPAAPYSVTIYDNIERPVASASIAATVSISDAYSLATTLNTPSGLSALESDARLFNISRTFYSQRGLAYRTLQSLTEPSSGARQWSAVDHRFDALGRELSVASPKAATVKRQYDVLGRVTSETRTIVNATSLTSFSDWTSMGIGVHMEKVDTSFHAGTSLPSLVAKTVRVHTDVPSSLNSAHDGVGAHAITTYAATAYDAARRAVAAINYGTNTSEDLFMAGGAAPAIIPIPSIGEPSLSGLTGVMVSRTQYSARGIADRTIIRRSDSGPDQERTTQTLHDSLGRVIATIENVNAASPATVSWNSAAGRWGVSWASGAQADENRVTSSVFDALGRATLRTAHVRNGTMEGVSQSTLYRYTWQSGGA